MNRQVIIKAEQIARMVVKGIPLSRIAVEMGMSYLGLRRITMQPEYLKIEEAIRNEVTSKMDARLAKRAEMEDDVDDAIPEALSILLDGVRKKRDMRAALELLDRDPSKQFAKNNTHQRIGQPSGIPNLSSDLLKAAAKHADATATQVAQAPPQTQPQTQTNNIPPPKEAYDA